MIEDRIKERHLAMYTQDQKEAQCRQMKCNKFKTMKGKRPMETRKLRSQKACRGCGPCEVTKNTVFNCTVERKCRARKATGISQ